MKRPKTATPTRWHTIETSGSWRKSGHMVTRYVWRKPDAISPLSTDTWPRPEGGIPNHYAMGVPRAWAKPEFTDNIWLAASTEDVDHAIAVARGWFADFGIEVRVVETIFQATEMQEAKP